MTAFICEGGVLTVDTQGQATCTGAWVQEPMPTPIEPAQAEALTVSVALLFAAAWIVVQIKNSLINRR